MHFSHYVDVNFHHLYDSYCRDAKKRVRYALRKKLLFGNFSLLGTPPSKKSWGDFVNILFSHLGDVRVI